MRATIFMLVVMTLVLAGPPVSAQVSISDIINVVQFVRDWVRDNKPAQPAQPTPQRFDNSVYVYYKWVGTYDYLIEGNTALTDCTRWFSRYYGPRRKENFLLFVVLVQNRADAPIYVRPNGFYLDTYATNGKQVTTASILFQQSLCVEPPWGERDTPPNAPSFIRYPVETKNIPIIKENRLPGGLLRPGQEISGQLIMMQGEEYLHGNYSFKFGYSDGRHSYNSGDFLAGSAIQIFYRDIPG